MKWKIEYFSEIDSTQKYLLRKKEDLNYYCVWSEYQTDGIGTKGRSWEGVRGNLFFSFIIDKDEFSFIPLQSISVYFSFILYKVLSRYQENLLIKWPNDIYILKEKPKKLSGILTNIRKNKIICGIGINTKYAPKIKGEYESGCLDKKIKNDRILKEFLYELQKKKPWEEIFIEYKKVFEKSKKFFGIEYELNNDATLKAINGRSNNCS